MFFIRLIHYFLGYVCFRIYGDYPERLLNILAHKRISVWNAVRRNGYIEARMYIKDYKKMHLHKGKLKVKCLHTSVHGLFVKMGKYRARLGFAVGVVVFVLVIKFLSLFIWQIEVVGNKTVESAEILAAVSRTGVEIGALKTYIDAFNISEKILLELPSLSWAAVNIEGSLATVDVSEVEIVPNREGEEPCNLKATADGIITGHRVTSGTVVVKTGQTVAQGDLLVSGIIDYAQGGYGLKHSAGQVYAQTKHELEVFIEYNQSEQFATGEVNVKRAFNFFGINIPLYLGSEYYEHESTAHENKLIFFEKSLPISITTAEFEAVRTIDYTLSKDAAIARGKSELQALSVETFGEAEIISESEQIIEQNDGILVKNLYICNENIAMEEILSISAIKIP